MADPTDYRPAPGTIPTDPGVYKFRDASRRVVYVGKAKNLRSRLSNYFQDLSQLHPRTRQMVQAAASVEWTVVASEVEALQLEYTWIKKFDPKFNVKYRDDKTYPFLAVSTGEEIPRAFVYRGPRRKHIRYFGPYSHAWAIRETLDLLTRVFPVRTCSTGVLNRHRQLGRPCLLGYIDKCCAPCVGRVSPAEHRRIVDDFCSFMSGHTDAVVKNITRQMEKASENLEFEKAARLRDDLTAISKAMQRQAVVLGDGTDADLVGLAADELEVSIQIFHVRGGRIRGQRGWVVDKTGDSFGRAAGDVDSDPALAEMVQNFLVQFYGDAVERENDTTGTIVRRGVDKDEHADLARVSPVPREVLVQVLPSDVEETCDFLSKLRGAKVTVRVAQRGDKKALADTVAKNAAEALKQHKLKRTGDLTTRSQALGDIQQALGMEDAPLRIECTDISHISGTDVVASLVVFEDGLPKKSDYRRYRIKDAAGDGHSDDVASIAEITRRRFLRHREDIRRVPGEDEFDGSRFRDEAPDIEEQSTDGRKFAYPPQLFIVDGGAPQVAAAREVFDELGVTDVTLIGLAKRLEEIWVPDDDEPVILPRGSHGLFLLQHIRDEAHRFAITYHRQQRSKRLRVSELDGVAGLGPARRTELVKHFGSVKRLKQATVEEIREVKGFGPQLAQAVHDSLHP
ncbi:excinuclease ABC subunit UvrC [Corynebacterium mendelii]|uniref:UvrABC system protein C n=1 Tax=Corynebacterium mendelii TaxID=2765362 RepID=A0A939IX92_9CORY|nr:excinuclease ABC subunit UvrC [Corynebacterium mendelii]MBN9643432.1 excinuclease ABC subunit UvrC [Corynebacterium mendelii]